MEEVVSQCQYHENCSLIFKCSLCHCLYCSKYCELVDENLCSMDKMNKCQIVNYIESPKWVLLFPVDHGYERRDYLFNIVMNTMNYEGDVTHR